MHFSNLANCNSSESGLYLPLNAKIAAKTFMLDEELTVPDALVERV